MLSATITFTVPTGSPGYQQIQNVTTVGTPLDGLQPGVPLLVTSTADITQEAPMGGCNLVGVRASAADTLRFTTSGLRGQTLSVLVTDLSR